MGIPMRRTFILFSDETKTFTMLNAYNRKSNTFEGEYSLVHNAYSKDHFFLNKFLINHENIPVVLIGDENTRYREIINHFEHFLEDDIAKYMEERFERDLERQRELFKRRSVDDLKINVLRKTIDEELNDLKEARPKDDEDRYIQMGEKLALKKILRIIDDLMRMDHAHRVESEIN